MKFLLQKYTNLYERKKNTKYSGEFYMLTWLDYNCKMFNPTLIQALLRTYFVDVLSVSKKRLSLKLWLGLILSVDSLKTKIEEFCPSSSLFFPPNSFQSASLPDRFTTCHPVPLHKPISETKSVSLCTHYIYFYL